MFHINLRNLTHLLASKFWSTNRLCLTSQYKKNEGKSQTSNIHLQVHKDRIWMWKYSSISWWHIPRKLNTKEQIYQESKFHEPLCTTELNTMLNKFQNNETYNGKEKTSWTMLKISIHYQVLQVNHTRVTLWVTPARW
jgi:hypothetical protein